MVIILYVKKRSKTLLNKLVILILKARLVINITFNEILYVQLLHNYKRITKENYYDHSNPNSLNAVNLTRYVAQRKRIEVHDSFGNTSASVIQFGCDMDRTTTHTTQLKLKAYSLTQVNHDAHND